MLFISFEGSGRDTFRHGTSSYGHHLECIAGAAHAILIKNQPRVNKRKLSSVLAIDPQMPNPRRHIHEVIVYLSFFLGRSWLV